MQKGIFGAHNPEVVGSSPASATKKDSQPFGWLCFFVIVHGLEEGGDGEAIVKKCPVDTYLARGRVHGWQAASGRMLTVIHFVSSW